MRAIRQFLMRSKIMRRRKCAQQQKARKTIKMNNASE